MTTLPDRLNYIHNVIKSILRQSRPLDALYLHIPDKTMKGKPYIIPENFLKGLDVIINRCDKDYGPVTKLIPVLDLETDPNTKIITFDDDMYVHRDVVKLLERGIKEHPNSALSFSGWCTGYCPFYMEYIYSSDKDVSVDWIQGTHSILYHRSMLNKEDILTCNDIPCIVMNDDHRMAYYLAKNNIDRIVLSGNTSKLFKNMEHAAISSISKRFTFIWEIFAICSALRSKKLYTRHVSMFYSILFYVIIMIAVSICIVIFVPYLLVKAILIIFLGVLFSMIYNDMFTPTISI